MLPYRQGPHRFPWRRWAKRLGILAIVLTLYVGSYAYFWRYRHPAANMSFCVYTENSKCESILFVGYYPLYWLHRTSHEWIYGKSSFTRHNWDRRAMTWADSWDCIKSCWYEEKDEDDGVTDEDTTTEATSQPETR